MEQKVFCECYYFNLKYPIAHDSETMDTQSMTWRLGSERGKPWPSGQKAEEVELDVANTREFLGECQSRCIPNIFGTNNGAFKDSWIQYKNTNINKSCIYGHHWL